MSCYSIYFDETGDFQGSGDFYAICGFVWKGDAISLKDQLKDFCTNLGTWLTANRNDDGKSMPECLHTTSNNSLKRLLSRHTPESDLLHNRLKDFPIAVTGIYAFKKEINPDDFIQDAVYRKMIHILLRQITKQIHRNDSEASITFHIPTRSTVFETDEEKKRHEYQQNDIMVGRIGNGSLGVSMNTPEAFIDIRRELGVTCSVREITYKTQNPDQNDNIYHTNRNTESTLWGYYTADIINYWIKTFADRPGKQVEELRAEIASLMDVSRRKTQIVIICAFAVITLVLIGIFLHQDAGGWQTVSLP